MAEQSPTAAPLLRVRIYVAVDSDGEFSCGRYWGAQDDDWLADRYGGACRVSILEAEVPVPVPPGVVQGRIVEEGER